MTHVNDYHKKQYENVYRSTEKFVEWLEGLGYLDTEVTQNICDIGCGGGVIFSILAIGLEKVILQV